MVHTYPERKDILKKDFNTHKPVLEWGPGVRNYPLLKACLTVYLFTSIFLGLGDGCIDCYAFEMIR